MRIPGFVLGYHGCDKDVAEAVLNGKTEVRSSTNSYDWLGSGAYFWENNPARAFSWAKLLARSKSLKIKTPAVVGAIIDPGNCLDLAEESSQELVKAAFEGLRLLHGSSGEPMPINEPGHQGDADLVKRHLDCAVLNFLHQTRLSENLPPLRHGKGTLFRRRRAFRRLQAFGKEPYSMVRPRSHAERDRLFPPKRPHGHRGLKFCSSQPFHPLRHRLPTHLRRQMAPAQPEGGDRRVEVGDRTSEGGERRVVSGGW